MTPEKPYAGDLAPVDAWKILADDPAAVLVDVRTQPEWVFVGTPDLSSLDKKVVMVQWQVFPSMAKNPAFADQVAAQGVTPDRPVLFLCRSGARSAAAAELLAAKGFAKAYNVSEGFEGALDDGKHRGVTGGWKAAGLPWVQG